MSKKFRVCSITNTEAVTQWARDYTRVAAAHSVTMGNTIVVDMFSQALEHRSDVLRPVCFFATSGDGTLYPYSNTYFNTNSVFKPEGDHERAQHFVDFLQQLGAYILIRKQKKTILIPDGLYVPALRNLDQCLLKSLYDTVVRLHEHGVCYIIIMIICRLLLYYCHQCRRVWSHSRHLLPGY